MNNTIHCVQSKDGTTIGYRQLGSGPGLVLLHGAMESGLSHLQLAEALSGDFTVYLPDRRGRGLSGPYSKDYQIDNDVEDMEAILAQTGAQNVFGISAGALIWLNAALTLPGIRKAALYEPALPVNGSISTAFLKRYAQELAQGKTAAALVTAMKGAQMGPPIFNLMPRWLLERLSDRMMKKEDKKAKNGEITMRALAPTLYYDFTLVAGSEGMTERYNTIEVDTLLLGGSKSPQYLKSALNTLALLLPHVRRVEFPGLDHSGAGNTDRGGKPGLVAAELRGFFI